MAAYFCSDENSPEASRIHAGVVVALFHQNKVLLDCRRDGGWGLIGGAMEVGESVVNCGKREVMEETGLEVSNLKIVGIFSLETSVRNYHQRLIELNPKYTLCQSLGMT